MALNFKDIKTHEFDLLTALLYRCFEKEKAYERNIFNTLTIQEMFDMKHKNISYWYKNIIYDEGMLKLITNDKSIPEILFCLDNGHVVCTFVFPDVVDIEHAHNVYRGHIEAIIEKYHSEFLKYLKYDLCIQKKNKLKVTLAYSKDLCKLFYEHCENTKQCSIKDISMYVPLKNSDEFFADKKFVDDLTHFMSCKDVNKLKLSFLLHGSEEHHANTKKIYKLFKNYSVDIVHVDDPNATGVYNLNFVWH